MKKHIYIIALLFAAAFITACSGDHATRNGRDTAKEHYQVQGSGVDTSKTTTTTGDASNIDNSGSGGTMVARDSSNLKDSLKIKSE